MTRDELEQLLEYDREKENDWIFMPNEIFTDFPKEFAGNASTPAFAYSYYYLISYLYYFTKYSSGSSNRFDVATLKRILGYSSGNKPLNDIIKKDGNLDQIGYTESTTDYPIERIWGDIDQLHLPYELRDNKQLSFATYYDLSNDMKAFFHREYGRPPKIKKPLKGFYRDCDIYEGVGAFFVPDHTTRIPVEVFLKCMTDESLGTIGFYLYSWLKYKCEYFGGELDASQRQLEEWCGVGRTILMKCLKALEQNNMIGIVRKKFIPGLPEGQREANTYVIKDWHEFSQVKQAAVSR